MMKSVFKMMNFALKMMNFGRLIGLGEGPGCWQPEPYAPVKKDDSDTTSAAGCCEKTTATAADFVSAFQFPPFRWLFLCNVPTPVNIYTLPLILGLIVCTYSPFAGI